MPFPDHLELWGPKGEQRGSIYGVESANDSSSGVQSIGNPIAFSPDGSLLATVQAGSETADIWDAHTRKPMGKLVGHVGPIASLDFVDNDTVITAGALDSTIRIWSIHR